MEYLCFYLASLLLYYFLWLRNRDKENPDYRKASNSAFLRGAISTFPIIGVSMVFSLILAFTGLKQSHFIIYQALFTIVALALSEELVNFTRLRDCSKRSSLSIRGLMLRLLWLLSVLRSA